MANDRYWMYSMSFQDWRPVGLSSIFSYYISFNTKQFYRVQKCPPTFAATLFLEVFFLFSFTIGIKKKMLKS